MAGDGNLFFDNGCCVAHGDGAQLWRWVEEEKMVAVLLLLQTDGFTCQDDRNAGAAIIHYEDSYTWLRKG